MQAHAVRITLCHEILACSMPDGTRTELLHSKFHPPGLLHKDTVVRSASLYSLRVAGVVSGFA